MVAQGQWACKSRGARITARAMMVALERSRGIQARVLQLLCIALVLQLGVRAHAATLLPLQTQDASPLRSGTAEVVLGATYFHNANFPAFTPPAALDSQQLVAGPQLGLHIAVTDWVEIQATFEGLYLDESRADGTQHSTYGSGDAQLWTKVRLWRERTYRPVVALHFGAKLPNANQADRLGTDETDFMIEVLASKQLGPIAAHLNLGIALLGNPGPTIGAPDRSSNGQDDLVTYALALAWPVLGVGTSDGTTFQLFGELVGASGSRFDNDRLALRAGAQVRTGHWTFFAGPGAGLIDESEDVSVSAGVIYTFTLERLAAWAE